MSAPSPSVDPVRERIAEMITECLGVCGSCDAGLPTSCTCAGQGVLQNALASTVAALTAVLDLADELDETAAANSGIVAAAQRYEAEQIRFRVATGLGVTP